MNYKINPGFVLIKICDTHLLVAKREMWEQHNRVHVISKKYAVCWSLMEQGKTSDEVIQSMGDLFHKPFEEVSRRFDPVFQDLARKGYLLPA